MKNDSDLDRLTISHLGVPVPANIEKVIAQTTRPPRHRPGEKFLRGPIPLDWLSRASALPGKALAVGLAVWFKAGMKEEAEVILSSRDLAQFRVGRKASYRALVELQRAGLIQTDRANGRCPRITLINP